MAATSLRKPAAIVRVHVVEIVRMAVVLTFATPECAPAAFIPARCSGFNATVLNIWRRFGWGSYDAGCGCGKEEEAEFHAEFLEEGINIGL